MKCLWQTACAACQLAAWACCDTLLSRLPHKPSRNSIANILPCAYSREHRLRVYVFVCVPYRLPRTLVTMQCKGRAVVTGPRNVQSSSLMQRQLLRYARHTHTHTQTHHTRTHTHTSTRARARGSLSLCALCVYASPVIRVCARVCVGVCVCVCACVCVSSHRCYVLLATPVTHW